MRVQNPRSLIWILAWLSASGLAAEGQAPTPPHAPAPPTAASPNELFSAIAQRAQRGEYPKYFLGEQTYFTVVGADGGGREGLLNEEGALEVDQGAFSIEPFLYARGKLATWNDAAITQELERGYLPVPSVNWRWNAIALKITAFAPNGGEPALYARYRLENTGHERERVKLLLAIRPFQVNPPWQSLNMAGGVSPIHDIELHGPLIRVAGGRIVAPLDPPQRFGALAFGEGALIDTLAAGKPPHPTKARDPSGFASAALEYDLDLPPGAARDIYLEIPYPAPEPRPAAAEPGVGRSAALARQRLAETLEYWETKLGRVDLVGPPAARGLADKLRSNLAYIFINRDDHALYPGSRDYARSWIRDSAIISSALLGMGYTEEPRRFVEWYARFQFPDGKIPCCVDGRGPDGTPENDSHGEFIYAVAEYHRFTHDLGFVRELWPAVAKAVGYIESQRARRKAREYQAPDKLPFFGLMPESISHEGYAAHPVHSYWDDFWTLRGLKDAAELARLANAPNAAHYAELRDEFRADLYASLKRAMAKHGIAFLPGSVELGDFDSTATAMIVNIAGEQPNLPLDALLKTFDEYWAYFQKRRDGKLAWDAYTPYEVRTVEALVRLGRRREALELLEFLLAGQRPPAWNHWAEVVWRDPKAPKFIGDMPHAWIGAEFVRAVRSFFAYERDEDRALVLAAGIPESWLDGSGVGVRRLPTWFGTLDYTLRRVGPDELRLSLAGDLALPPGKIVVKPPAGRPLRAVRINGKPSAAFSADAAVVGEFPAEVVLRYGAAPDSPVQAE